MRSEERVVRAEWEAPRRGNESIAQRQATSGAAPWGGMSGEMRPVRAKVRYSKQGVLLLPLQGAMRDVRYTGRCPVLCSAAPSGRLF